MRSGGSLRPQGPESKAARAALTASVDVGRPGGGDFGDGFLGVR